MQQFRCTMGRFSLALRVNMTATADLNADAVLDFLAWLKRRGLSPRMFKAKRTGLLTLWKSGYASAPTPAAHCGPLTHPPLVQKSGRFNPAGQGDEDRVLRDVTAV
ncbi:MAG: hypothetical protein JNM18_16805 [Planctomycetaceae bacterium]|nr:hypothetical protein [Planctomycetaceae bacterium]